MAFLATTYDGIEKAVVLNQDTHYNSRGVVDVILQLRRRKSHEKEF